MATYFATQDPPYPYYTTSDDPMAVNTSNPPGIYNLAGRGFPDVSAVGDNIVASLMGALTLLHGTSASAAVFASILTRTNELRLAAGKSTVGFVNPTL